MMTDSVNFHAAAAIVRITYAKRSSHVDMRTAAKPTVDRNWKLR